MTTSVMISRYPQLIGNLICGTVLSGIYTSYILSICNVAVKKNAAQSRAVIISHTTLCQATILHLSYYILLNPCKIFSHLTNLIPTFCIPTKEQKVFGVTERLQYWQNCFLPPSYLFDTHPASFLLVHQLVNCWKLLQTPHLRHFWTLNHHSAYLSLLLPPILLVVSSQNSFKMRDDWLMSSNILSKLGDIASRSAGSTTQVPVYSSKNKLAAHTSLLHLLLVSHQSHLPLLTSRYEVVYRCCIPSTRYQWYMNEDGIKFVCTTGTRYQVVPVQCNS